MPCRRPRRRSERRRGTAYSSTPSSSSASGHHAPVCRSCIPVRPARLISANWSPPRAWTTHSATLSQRRPRSSSGECSASLNTVAIGLNGTPVRIARSGSASLTRSTAPRWSYQATIGLTGAPCASRSTPDSPTLVTPTPNTGRPHSATTLASTSRAVSARVLASISTLAPSTTHGVAAEAVAQLVAVEVDDDGLDPLGPGVHPDQHAVGHDATSHSIGSAAAGSGGWATIAVTAPLERQLAGGVRHDEGVAARRSGAGRRTSRASRLRRARRPRRTTPAP